MFDDFDNYLGLEFLVDYWYDEGVVIASTLLANFDDYAWNELAEKCSLRPVNWQIRCAEVLDLVTHPVSTMVLVKFLSSENDDVVVAAADSLRSKSDAHIPVDSIEKLKNLWFNGSPPVKAALGDFLSRMDKK